MKTISTEQCKICADERIKNWSMVGNNVRISTVNAAEGPCQQRTKFHRFPSKNSTDDDNQVTER